MKRLLTAALASTALVLAACSSTPEAAGEEDTPAAQDMGPLAEYMGWANFDDEASNAKNEEMQRKVEELTASCMKEEGFEYKPVSYENQVYEDPNAEAYKMWGTREFAEKYGYGIAMQRATQDQMNQNPQEWVDPNQEYVEAMSESEQAAYYEALYGSNSGMGMASSAVAVPEETAESSGESSGAESVDPSATAETTEEVSESVEEAPPAEPSEAEAIESAMMPSPEEMGCSGKASAEVYPQSYTQPDDEMNQMWEELNRRTTALEENPELKKATEDWRNCMADKGFPGLTSPMDVNQDLTEELAKLYGETFTDMGDGGYSIDSPEEPVTPDPAELEAFKQKEISQAVADFDCAVGLTELRQKLQFEIEEKFIEEYSEPLARQREMENG